MIQPISRKNNNSRRYPSWSFVGIADLYYKHIDILDYREYNKDVNTRYSRIGGAGSAKSEISNPDGADVLCAAVS